MTNGICIRTNNDYGFCEEYPNFLPQIWFSCPGLNSNQIFGTDNMICNPYPYDSESYQIFSKDKFISDGQCIIRYKDRDYEVHCCCYHFRQNCTIRLDNKMHICADRTEMAENGIKQTVITTTLQSLPLGSSCFTSFQLNITDEETVHLISTSYGVPTMTRNDIHRCYQYISEDQSIQCSATESCQKMCPLVAPIPANLSHTLTEFGQQVLINNNNKYMLTKCAYRHILQHIFFSKIYANNCILYYDFNLMKPLNLIYGYNMEFESSAEEIYGSKNELTVADVFEYRNLENRKNYFFLSLY
ncbi:unnamed protein product [Cercopithifilaria johnstoni]|uniref:Uncharacterized protein n=1 Tax=Cercopithifilaria johnstoni TaxID=2874296 RepID=A0A8J2LZG8_9BILA|nr:unnamed protein product [Cercopithifilaria johnstoni]